MYENQPGQAIQDAKVCTGENKIRESSRVEIALDNLSGRVHHLEKLAEEIVDSVMSPQPVPCSPEGISCNGEPTLSQQINRVHYRLDDVTQRLALALDVIKQNLGEIKLD